MRSLVARWFVAGQSWNRPVYILKSGSTWYKRERNVTLGYFKLWVSFDSGASYYELLSYDITEVDPVIDVLHEYRHRIVDDNYHVDQTLTATGYAGIENVDWENIEVVDGWASYWNTRKPSNLTVKQPGATTAELLWDDAAQAADGLRVYKSIDNITFTEVGTVAYGEEYYNVTGLTEGLVYYFKLVAYRGVNESDAITTNTVKWWTATGISDVDILAVYMPVGASSKANSLVNLVSPGTGDMVETGSISWLKSLGWYGFSATAYLDSIAFKSHTYSIVILVDNVGANGYGRAFSAEAAGPTGALLLPNFDNETGRFRMGTMAGSFPVNENRCLYGATQTKYFVEGEVLGNVIPTGGEVTDTLRVGNLSTTPSADGIFKGRVLAMAIYKNSITDAQMIEIHNKMKSIGYFRDFSLMTKYESNPIITKGVEAWRADGASIPYVQPDNLSSDGYYYSFVPVSAGSWTWNDLALFRSQNLLDWLPYGTNPVVSAIPDTWEAQFMSHPCPIKIGTNYYLYYTSSDALNISRLGRIVSTDLKTWIRDEDNPLYEDPVNSCHSAWINQIGDTYYLYYRRSAAADGVIHYATSADCATWAYGGQCWTTVTGDLDKGFYSLDPFVWQRKDGLYEMLYTVWLSDIDDQKLTYAISEDGINFHKMCGWVITGSGVAGSWDNGMVGVPVFFKISNKQTYLYYCGAKDITFPFSENSGGLAIIPN